MKCAKCGAPLTNGPLIRINEKGVPGIFWCEMCCRENHIKLDEKLVKEINIIDESLNKRFTH